MQWRKMAPVMWAKRRVRRVDSAITSLLRPLWRTRAPRVLFDVHNAIGLEAQRPVIAVLVARGKVQVEVASAELTSEQLADGVAAGACVVPPSRARHRRYDVAVITDRSRIRPWRVSRVAFLHHGSSHAMYPEPFQERLYRAGGFDCALCLSEQERRQWVASFGEPMRSRTVVTGQPKLDVLVNHRYDREEFLARLDLDPGRPTVLLYSHWTEASLFRSSPLGPLRDYFAAGRANLIVTAHPLLLDPDIVGGVDWSSRLRALFDGPRMRVLPAVTDRMAMVAAADVYVGDHSSLTVECAILERPQVVYRNPAFAFVDPALDALLRATAHVVDDAGALPAASDDALRTPHVDPGARQRLLVYSFGFLGESAARAADAVEALASTGTLHTDPPEAA